MASLVMELQLGVRIFADHTRGNKRKQNASTIFARRAAFHVCISSHSDRSTYTQLTNHDYFDREKNLNTPNGSPVPG